MIMIADEAEIEFSGLLFGFLMSAAIGFITTANIQNAEFENGWVHVDASSSLKLYGSCAVTFLLFLGAVRLEHCELKSYPVLAEYIEAHAQSLNTWNVLCAVRYFAFTMVDETSKSPYVMSTTVQTSFLAFCASPVLAMSLIAFDFLGDSGYLTNATTSELIESVSLFTGLLWEQAFHNSIVTIVTGGRSIHDLGTPSNSDHHENGLEALKVGCFCIGVVGTIYPAWKWFLLPETVKPIPKRNTVS